MTHTATTIDPTRIRANHNTASETIGNLQANTPVVGSEIFTATQELRNANGVYQKIGDVWMKGSQKVGNIHMLGWVAVIHMGEFICRDFKEEGTETPSDEFVSATLTRKDGTTVEFVPKG